MTEDVDKSTQPETTQGQPVDSSPLLERILDALKSAGGSIFVAMVLSDNLEGFEHRTELENIWIDIVDVGKAVNKILRSNA